MAGLFYKGTLAVGNGLATAWDFATGNRMLHKRGIAPHYDFQAATLALGTVGGLAIGVPVAAILTGSVTETLAVWAACAFAPVIATQVPVALFRAGKYDVQQQQRALLADQRKQQVALPEPSEPPLI